MKDFRQITWDHQVVDDLAQILALAVREDIGRTYDWTTVALVPDGVVGRADVVARRPGVVAGLAGVEQILREFSRQLVWETQAIDGQAVTAGQVLGTIGGPARSLLTAERVLLNLVSHLSGIATLTAEYVAAVSSTSAAIYDTRKTLPGWRRLEKYAVRMGGGRNHRLGLSEAVLIKDNHLALGAAGGVAYHTAAEAVRNVRLLVERTLNESDAARFIIEVELDSLADFEAVMDAGPDIILLDNMPLADLCDAVARRERAGVRVALEASGGVNLKTVAEIAATGVDRISVGALTHAAPWLDLGLDWR